MKLRIITATLGESPYLAEAAASVEAAAPAAEHIVVCPEPRSAAIRALCPRVVAVTERARALYPALNQGLREPAGDWDAFTWINDDDLLRAPGFGAAVAFAVAHPEVDIVFGRVELIDGRGGSVADAPVARRGSDLAALFARGIIPFAQPGTIIRRAIWERLGGLDESYRIVGDMDFFIRAVVAGARFAFVDAEVAAFRLNAGQLSKRREEVVRETARALLPLAGQSGSAASVARFRIANLPAYLDRVRRHGWVSMRELYDQVH
jgi:hypothetical protein